MTISKKLKQLYDSLLSDHPEALQEITELSRNTSDNKDFVICSYKAFNFDLINNLNADHPNWKEKSPDALFLHDDRIYFIEFKEGSAKKDDIRLKIHEAIITLYHYALNKKILTRDEFVTIDIRYAVIMRTPEDRDGKASFLPTLERSSTKFNLKNIEGLLIKQTNVLLTPEKILGLLKKISGGEILTIKIKSKSQTEEIEVL